MVKRKATIRKKASPSVKTRHDSEIRRAKLAVSAATTPSPSASPAPQTQRPAAISPQSPVELAPGIMKRLLQAATSPFVTEVQPKRPQPIITPAQKPTLTFLANPLTDLARRHVHQTGQLPPDLPSSIDDHCHKLLTSLANARIQAALQQAPDRNYPLSDSLVSNGS